MEGITYEALSLAGHLGLDNLIVIFDSNKISIDGSTDLAVSENHLRKMQSFGFKTEEIDGHNIFEIDSAFKKAKNKIMMLPITVNQPSDG
jgi:transketolase